MSFAGIALDLVLIGLLLAALFIGLRLQRQLKTLRATQDAFVKAVADLDGAAARAEQGLADLRAATAEASDALATRIAAAKLLADRLDGAVQAPRPTAEPRGLDNRPEPRRAEARQELRFPESLLVEPRAAEARAPEPRRPAPAPERAAASFDPRSRARVDDDLFDTDRPPLKSILGGRR